MDQPEASPGIEVRLVVPEMDCPSCAKKVDASLEPIEGVEEVILQPTTGTATITYDPDVVSKSALVEAIEGAGYAVANGDDDEGPAIAPPAAIWRSRRAILTWIGAVALVVGLLLEFLLTGANVEVGSILGRALTLADTVLLFAAAVSGVPVVRSGYYSARARSLDIDFLMATAIVAATGIGYFLEAATLAVLFSIAELLEEYSMDRARDSLRELLALAPETATVRREGERVTLPIESVGIGETVVVTPGEKIPLDGVVVEGQSAVDQAPITGESVPVEKSTGDRVFAGSIAESGFLAVEVTAAASDSTLARIIDMVQGAQQKQTKREQFVDRFAGYYTPVVVAFAILTAAVPPLLLGWPWETWFIRGLTLLVIACPCAFVISTPVSVVSGVTSAARNGVLIKGGNHLETMGEVEAVAFDKTGTVTKGELAVTDVVPFGEFDRGELLRYVGTVEQHSEHPIGEAIRSYVDESDVSIVEPASFEALPGEGVRGEVDGEDIYAGTPALFESLGFDLSHAHYRTDGGLLTKEDDCGRTDCIDVEASVLRDLERDGKSIVLVGTETAIFGVIAIADEVRADAARTVERLHEQGIEHVVLITGDNEGTARAVAEEVGIDEYFASCLPDEKVEAIADLQEQFDAVAMVGDGINDAPALATADVGIAMGAAGTDTALETADIALMGDDLSKLPYLHALSQRSNRVIRENIWASLGVKALLAVGVPFGYVPIWLAVVVGDMGMSLGVTGNAMRLSRIRPESE